MFFAGRQCSARMPQNSLQSNTDSIKKIVRTEILERADLKSKSKRADSIVYKWRDRWHEIKTEIGTKPCDSILPIIVHVADSVIIVDSTALVAKSRIIALDDSIICNQASIIKIDSITILGLKKEIRRQKRQKWLIGISAAIFSTAILTK